MKDKLIEYSTAKLAKEKGFVVEKYPYYTSPDSIIMHSITKCLIPHYYAATQSLLQKWLRDREENIIIVIPMRDFHRNYNGWYYEVFTQLTKKDKPVLIISSDENFDTYEEALEKGLQEALKLI